MTLKYSPTRPHLTTFILHFTNASSYHLIATVLPPIAWSGIQQLYALVLSLFRRALSMRPRSISFSCFYFDYHRIISGSLNSVNPTVQEYFLQLSEDIMLVISFVLTVFNGMWVESWS